MDSPLNTRVRAEPGGQWQVHQDVLAMQLGSAKGPSHVYRTRVHTQAS